MEIIQSLQEIEQFHQKNAGKTLGFVPTMGCLHAGHAALMQRALKENEVTVLSIFLNPTQFNKPDDLQNYPRTTEDDIQLATDLGVDCIFMPASQTLYPDGNHFPITPSHSFANILEGEKRPGHFSGMLTVVLKLFQLIKPTRAYFGEKDYQQLLLVCEMCKAYFLDVELIPCETVREASGLPLSSRNQRLNSTQRQTADQFATIFHNASLTLDEMLLKLNALPLILEYLENHENRLFVAVQIDGIRLIDNRVA